MPKGALPVVIVAVLTLFAAATFRQGWRDMVHSAIHWSYSPIRDMRETVVLNPQKVSLRAPDSLSVPVNGIDRDLGRDVLAATLVNPTAPADLDSSIRRGEIKFQKTCIPCHGPAMAGNGAVAPMFMPPPDLLAAATRARKDGYIYSYIRHGGVVMPSYGAQVTRQEAWDLVNYIRHMQKVSPR